MSDAARLIDRLRLVPHPEGGHYRRVHTSSQLLTLGARTRAAVSSIVYLLQAGEMSRWHRVDAEELWHFTDGAPLNLHIADPQFQRVTSHRLGPVASDAQSTVAVPPGHWQAAETQGAFTLVSCTVVPAFEFDGFSLLADDPAADAQRRAVPAALAHLI